jgi:hypothetical protein
LAQTTDSVSSFMGIGSNVSLVCKAFPVELGFAMSTLL